jgi:hypothetical protein
MTMHRRLTRLEQVLPAPDPEEALRQKRWKKVLARFVRQLEQAAALLSPEEEQVVEKAMASLLHDDGSDGHRLGNAYACWLRDLQNGWSRMPKLPPAAMKELAVAWSSPGASGGMVCQRCGVEYPHQNNRPVLAACLGCASREWDWAHLVEGYDRPWKELDGYVGSRMIGGVT